MSKLINIEETTAWKLECGDGGGCDGWGYSEDDSAVYKDKEEFYQTLKKQGWKFDVVIKEYAVQGNFRKTIGEILWR